MRLNEYEHSLCRLHAEDKQRICIAVFNSKYFEERITFSNTNRVQAFCELLNISFQTELGKTETAEHTFREWMLDCRPGEDEAKFDYLLSHAYQSHQIFIYFRNGKTGEVYPENLTINLRLNVVTTPGN